MLRYNGGILKKGANIVCNKITKPADVDSADLAKSTLINSINTLIGGDEQSAHTLAQFGRIKQYSKGCRIYPDNDELLGFLYVVSGKIRFFSVASNGREISIFSIGEAEGCIISTSCILESFDGDVVLEFMADSCVYVMPNEAFNMLSKQNENIAHFSLSLISKRLKQAFETINDVAFNSLRARVLKFLKHNAKNGRIQTSQEEIAQNIGSAREAVARVIKELRESGLIETRRGEIMLRGDDSANHIV